MVARSLGITAVNVAVSCSIALVLAAPVPAAQAQAKQDNAKQRHIESLIEQLASLNEAPKDPKGGSLTIPSGYDRQAQVRVLDAWKALIKEGHDAFPSLIAHLDDNRYSCSVELMSNDDNATVGDVCRLIVAYQVEVYQREVWVSMMSYRYTFSQKDLKQWWEERKGRSLRELQIESTEWALGTAKAASQPDARRTTLERLLRRLRSSDKPIGPGELTGTIIGARNMFGLPSDSKTRGILGGR